MELVSVIVPTFNSELVIGEALGSIARQKYPSIEIVIVDDGSSDNTVPVARELLRKQSVNWQIIELGVNKGPSAARNVGLRSAKGTWIQFLDSDDALMADKIERQMAVCATVPPDVAAVYSPWNWGLIEAGKIEWLGPVVRPSIAGRAPIMCLVSACRPLLNAGLTRLAALNRVGGFDETLRFWECEEINVRIAKIGRFCQVDSERPLYAWRHRRNTPYIGGKDARYNVTGVALGWIKEILRASENKSLETLTLPDQDNNMLLRECTLWGRAIYSEDRLAFRQYLTLARKLVPDLAPIYPSYIAALSRHVGYERAEAFAKLTRKPKVWLRSTLYSLELRRRNVMIEMK